MLQLIGFALRYLPLIVSAVAMIEALTDKSTSGADKKTVGIRVLKEILQKFGVTVNAQTEQLISQVIDIAVTILHVLGVFKRADEVGTASGPVAAEVVASAAAVIEASPTEARLRELEELMTR